MMAKIDFDKDDSNTAKIDKVKLFLLRLQQQIITALETEEDGQHFRCDEWTYKESGGGKSCVLEGGAIIEKAGVNFSHIRAERLPGAATQKRPELADAPFQATGVSVVVHAANPFVPTSHFNVRFIYVEKEQPIWWFGGGFDLTPYYPFEADCVHWHSVAKAACDPFGSDIYSRYKKWADDYFYLKHRQEARGIGGIFFDDLNQWGFDKCFEFMCSVGNNYLKAYLPILNKRKTQPYTEKEKQFQLYRRGRYVEFNLLYDRGTLFGLQSQGRTESILMSLPPLVAWSYNWHPEPNSKEHELYNYLKPREWI